MKLDFTKAELDKLRALGVGDYVNFDGNRWKILEKFGDKLKILLPLVGASFFRTHPPVIREVKIGKDQLTIQTPSNRYEGNTIGFGSGGRGMGKKKPAHMTRSAPGRIHPTIRVPQHVLDSIKPDEKGKSPHQPSRWAQQTFARLQLRRAAKIATTTKPV